MMFVSFFQLADHFPFKWTHQSTVFMRHYPSRVYDYKRVFSFTVRNGPKGPAKYFLCRSFTPTGEVLLGRVYVETPLSFYQTRCCTIYRAGHQWDVSKNYEVLVNTATLFVEEEKMSLREQSDYTWVNVTSWKDIPDSAIIHSLPTPYDWYGCNTSFVVS